MAASVRSTTNLGGATRSNITLTEPAGTASSDAMLMYVVVDQGAALTKPAGWTTLFAGSTATQFTYHVCYTTRGGTAPSYAWTNASAYTEACVTTIQPGSGAVVLDAQSANGSTGASGSKNFTPPPVTVVGASAVVICGGAFWAGSNANTWFAPPNYTLVSNTSVANNDAAMATRTGVGAGVETIGAFSGAALSQDWWEGFAASFVDTGVAGGVSQPPFEMGDLNGLGSGGRFFKGME